MYQQTEMADVKNVGHIYEPDTQKELNKCVCPSPTNSSLMVLPHGLHLTNLSFGFPNSGYKMLLFSSQIY